MAYLKIQDLTCLSLYSYFIVINTPCPHGILFTSWLLYVKGPLLLPFSSVIGDKYHLCIEFGFNTEVRTSIPHINQWIIPVNDKCRDLFHSA